MYVTKKLCFSKRKLLFLNTSVWLLYRINRKVFTALHWMQLPNPFIDASDIQNFDLWLFPLSSVRTGAIALINIPLERFFRGGVYREIRIAKHALLESYNALSEDRCFRSFSGQKLVVPGPWKSNESFFFESIAKAFHATLCTQWKSSRETMAIVI